MTCWWCPLYVAAATASRGYLILVMTMPLPPMLSLLLLPPPPCYQQYHRAMCCQRRTVIIKDGCGRPKSVHGCRHFNEDIFYFWSCHALSHDSCSTHYLSVHYYYYHIKYYYSQIVVANDQRSFHKSHPKARRECVYAKAFEVPSSLISPCR